METTFEIMNERFSHYDKENETIDLFGKHWNIVCYYYCHGVRSYILEDDFQYCFHIDTEKEDDKPMLGYMEKTNNLTKNELIHEFCNRYDFVSNHKQNY